MSAISFFEYLGLANIERIHSQTLAWIFSNDFKGFDGPTKNHLLQQLFNIESDEVFEKAETEKKHLDIVIETDKSIIAIENKIKSTQHSGQLERYEEAAGVIAPHKKVRLYYLTLINESGPATWTKITYARLLEILSAERLAANEKHSMFFEEYLIYLKKLVSAVNEFDTHVLDHEFVFTDGSKKKEEKVDSMNFIANNQLETILQKSYLTKIALQLNKLRPTEFTINETRGVALCDLTFKKNIRHNEVDFETFIQLQGSSLKFCFSANQGELERIHSELHDFKVSLFQVKVKLMEPILPLFRQLKGKNGYVRYNPPRSNAYVSISKTMKLPYYRMSIEDLCTLLIEELQNAAILTDELLKLLGTN
ncbi:MAG: hypothetical protein JWO06_3730 [Bacteroidota bacterium]|nr:hypothetical protein [Bacteroidota bacterium]